MTLAQDDAVTRDVNGTQGNYHPLPRGHLGRLPSHLPCREKPSSLVSLAHSPFPREEGSACSCWLLTWNISMNQVSVGSSSKRPLMSSPKAFMDKSCSACKQETEEGHSGPAGACVTKPRTILGRPGVTARTQSRPQKVMLFRCTCICTESSEVSPSSLSC